MNAHMRTRALAREHAATRHERTHARTRARAHTHTHAVTHAHERTHIRASSRARARGSGPDTFRPLPSPVPPDQPLSICCWPAGGGDAPRLGA